MKTYLYAIVLILGTNIISAQYAGTIADNSSPNAVGTNAMIASLINSPLGTISDRKKAINDKHVNYQGSPYTITKFTPTSLFYNNENLGAIYYRYNALNEEIEIKKTALPEEELQSLARDKKINILIDGNKMSFKTFVNSKKRTLNGYLTTLLDGKKYQLFKRIHVKYTEAQPAANSFTQAVPARFSKFIEYYFQKVGVNRIDEIPSSKNKLIKLVDKDIKEKLKTFIKEKNLNTKDENDLKEIFQFLNQ